MLQLVPNALSPISVHHTEESDSHYWAEESKTISLDLLFMGLDKTSSDCFSSNTTCSCPLTVLLTLCWSCSNLSANFLSWGTAEQTQYPSCGIHKCGIPERNNYSWPAGYIPANRLTYGWSLPAHYRSQNILSWKGPSRIIKSSL